jgi:hypothetical protein
MMALHAPWWARLFPTPTIEHVSFTSSLEVIEREAEKVRVLRLVEMIEEEARIYALRADTPTEDDEPLAE